MTVKHTPSVKALARHYLGNLRRFLREPRLLSAELGLSGAKIIGASEEGNALVKLNRTSPLGSRGTVLALPRDRVIFESVRQDAGYSVNVSKFLSDGLNRPTGTQGRAALLDIGANTGLVTLQTMRMAIQPHDYFLFEPVPQHIQAIRHNLRESAIQGHVHIHEVALADRHGTDTIFTEQLNHGNSSFLQEAIVHPQEQLRTLVNTVDTAQYFQAFGNEFDRFVIKSDTQGMDALILSRLPAEIWKKAERVAVEIWAVPSIKPGDVNGVLERCQDFSSISWDSKLKTKADLHEVFDFWTSKSSEEKNLFLSS